MIEKLQKKDQLTCLKEVQVWEIVSEKISNLSKDLQPEPHFLCSGEASGSKDFVCIKLWDFQPESKHTLLESEPHSTCKLKNGTDKNNT